MLRASSKGLLLSVKVTPKAARDEICGVRGGAVIVKVTAPPDKGKANEAVIALLAKAIGISKSSLELVAGDTARNKSLRVASHVEAVQSWAEGLPSE